jgi:hypothetical protein
MADAHHWAIETAWGDIPRFVGATVTDFYVGFETRIEFESLDGLEPALEGRRGASAAVATPASISQSASDEFETALMTCMEAIQVPEFLRVVFSEIGWTEVVEDFGGGADDIIYWQISPSEAVSVNVQPLRPLCTPTTQAVGVTEAVERAGEVAFALFGASVGIGEASGRNVLPNSDGADMAECSGYHVATPAGVLKITAGNAGQDPVCIDDGTSQVLIRY